MQKFLKIHCFHWKKTPFCFKYGCFSAFNMGSYYVVIFFIRQDAEACHTFKIYNILSSEGFKKYYFDGFRNFKTTFCKNWSHSGKTDFRKVYCKVQKFETVNCYTCVFFLLASVIRGLVY